MSTISKPSGNNLVGTHVTKNECVYTGMAIVFICLMVTFFTGDHNWLLGAMALLVINMVWPKFFTYVAKMWLGLLRLFGSFLLKFILSLVFIFALTPTALIRKLFGHDPMQLKTWKMDKKSVFKTRDHQYTPAEMEHPFK